VTRPGVATATGVSETGDGFRVSDCSMRERDCLCESCRAGSCQERVFEMNVMSKLGLRACI
jgi:hypothetical protein